MVSNPAMFDPTARLRAAIAGVLEKNHFLAFCIGQMYIDISTVCHRLGWGEAELSENHH